MATLHVFRNVMIHKRLMPASNTYKHIQNRCIAYTGLCFQQKPPTAGKQTYQRDKPHMNVGTIGHVDHGKTTLTAAITKVLSESKQAKFMRYDEIDKNPDEKRRGITINATIVNYQTKNRHYGHVDCPGHRDYIKNMITGTARMDSCILVVAATDGAMPQTREHIILAKNIGITKLLVFINKIDAADTEMIDLVEMEIRELLTMHGFDGDNTPIVAGSALKALEGTNDEIGSSKVKELLEKMDEYIPTPDRKLDMDFSLPIEGAMMITGRGLVVTGVLDQGTINKGVECEVVGYGKKMKSSILGIEMFKQSLSRAEAGDQMGCLIKNIKKDDVRKGMVLSKPGLFTMHNNIKANVYLLGKDEGGRFYPLMPLSQLNFFNRTFHGAVTVEIPDREMVMPGENVILDLKLQYEMPLKEGDRFTLRDGNGTCGYGVITTLQPNIKYEEYKDDIRKLKKKKAKDAAEAEADA